MHERVRRMILGAITGVILAVANDAFMPNGLHIVWRMVIAGAAGGLLYAALDGLSKRYVEK